jgi:hypothetical protein
MGRIGRIEEKSFSLRFTSLLSLSARFRRLLSWISLSLGLARSIRHTMGLRSFGYDNPYAIEPFEPLQEKVGYKAVPLLVQLSSEAKSLRLLVRALRLSIPSHPISRLLLLL